MECFYCCDFFNASPHTQLVAVELVGCGFTRSLSNASTVGHHSAFASVHATKIQNLHIFSPEKQMIKDQSHKWNKIGREDNENNF